MNDNTKRIQEIDDEELRKVTGGKTDREDTKDRKIICDESSDYKSQADCPAGTKFQSPNQCC